MLSGDLPYYQRREVLAKFCRGGAKFLVTTNVLSRGIDIPNVAIVINFDLHLSGQGAPDGKTYLNRCGRAGRFGKNAIIFYSK